LVGPTKAGKSTLSQQLAERTNMAVLDFPKFIQMKKLGSRTDEEQVRELIRYLVDQTSPRVLIEDFP
jgi:shikimate kinase